MTMVACPRRYRIILRGECGTLMAGVLDDLLIESCQGWTCVMALVHDESELYGLLDRFEDFALHVVSLNELGADVLRSRASGPPPVSLGSGGAACAAWLEGAAACDPVIVGAALGPVADNIEQSRLDVRAHAMAGLAALVAGGEPGTTYTEHIARALEHGVTFEEITGVLVALLPAVGAARISAFATATLEASAALPRISAGATGRGRPGGVPDLP